MIESIQNLKMKIKEVYYKRFALYVCKKKFECILNKKMLTLCAQCPLLVASSKKFELKHGKTKP